MWASTPLSPQKQEILSPQKQEMLSIQKQDPQDTRIGCSADNNYSPSELSPSRDFKHSLHLTPKGLHISNRGCKPAMDKMSECSLVARVFVPKTETQGNFTRKARRDFTEGHGGVARRNDYKICHNYSRSIPLLLS